MAILTLNEFPKERKPETEERIRRLRQFSESQTQNLSNQIAEIDKAIDNGELPPGFPADPEVENMIQYNGSGNNIIGSNVTNIQPQRYSDMPQNSYNDSINTYSSIINTAPNYNNFYQQNSYNDGYYNGYYSNNSSSSNYYSGYYNDETMVMIEEEQYKANMQLAERAKFYTKLYNQNNPNFDYEEYSRQVDLYYNNYKSAEIRKWTRIFKTYYDNAQKVRQQKEMVSTTGYFYDERGYREEKTSVRFAKLCDDGHYEILSPQNGPDGYRIETYSRREDEMRIYNRSHFYDPYIASLQRSQIIGDAMSQMYEKNKKYNEYTLDELYDGKLREYYYETVVKDSSAIVRAKLNASNWDKRRFDQLLNGQATYRNASTAFFSSYGMADYIHSLNLSKTPEELNLDQQLANKLKSEYDARRSYFMSRVHNKNVKTDMSAGARQRDVISHDFILDKTLDDYQKLTPNAQVEVIETPIMVGGIPVKRRVIETGVMSDDETKMYHDSLGNRVIDVEYKEVVTPSKPINDPDNDVLSLF